MGLCDTFSCMNQVYHPPLCLGGLIRPFCGATRIKCDLSAFCVGAVLLLGNFSALIALVFKASAWLLGIHCLGKTASGVNQ